MPMASGLSYDIWSYENTYQPMAYHVIYDDMKTTYRPCVLWGKTAKSWGSRSFPGTQIINNHDKRLRQTIIVPWINFYDSTDTTGVLPLCVRGRLKWWGVRVRYHTGRGQPGILNKYHCHLYCRSVINVDFYRTRVRSLATLVSSWL